MGGLSSEDCDFFMASVVAHSGDDMAALEDSGLETRAAGMDTEGIPVDNHQISPIHNFRGLLMVGIGLGPLHHLRGMRQHNAASVIPNRSTNRSTNRSRRRVATTGS
jgi:hypothetical protein